MRVYVYTILVSILLSVIFGTGWYVLFGYDPLKPVLGNILAIYTNMYFWKGVGIWTILYAVFFALPVAFLRNGRVGDKV